MRSRFELSVLARLGGVGPLGLYLSSAMEVLRPCCYTPRLSPPISYLLGLQLHRSHRLRRRCPSIAACLKGSTAARRRGWTKATPSPSAARRAPTWFSRPCRPWRRQSRRLRRRPLPQRRRRPLPQRRRRLLPQRRPQRRRLPRRCRDRALGCGGRQGGCRRLVDRCAACGRARGAFRAGSPFDGLPRWPVFDRAPGARERCYRRRPARLLGASESAPASAEDAGSRVVSDTRSGCVGAAGVGGLDLPGGGVRGALRSTGLH